MRVYGAALLARKHVVTKHFGERKWSELFSDMAARFPYFTHPVIASSIIPLPEFISFHDELVRRFFSGDSHAYSLLGEESARWAMTEGPYRAFMAGKDFEGLSRTFPETWSMYFAETSSYCTTLVQENSVEFEVFNLPIWHPYFEHFVVGYFKGVLDMICANPIYVARLSGGGKQYRYRFSMGVPGSLHDLSGPIAPSPERSKLQTLTAFIEEHLTEDVDITDLARLIGYSPDHMARLFKRSFDISLHQYVLQRRVERAKGLLQDRRLSIRDVSLASGFASQAHFSSIFKERVGVTPRAFRRGEIR
jgi:AraC-like DNA-binding protein